MKAYEIRDRILAYLNAIGADMQDDMWTRAGAASSLVQDRAAINELIVEVQRGESVEAVCERSIRMLLDCSRP